METVPQASCLECVARPGRLFCDLPAGALQDLDLVKSVNRYPRGTVLFREGHLAHNVFVLCSGRVRLSVCSESGRRLTLRIAGPGEVLGMSACLSGTPHEITAELLDNGQVALVKRRDLLIFLHQHREACMHVVSLLSQDLHQAYDRVRTIGLSRTRRPRLVHTHS